MNPLFDDAVIDCVATNRAPTVQELLHVAERSRADGAADRSAFRWDCLAPADPEKLFSMQAAQACAGGVLTDRRKLT